MPYTILIADDDKELAGALAVRCRGIGLDVVMAHDSLSALLAIESRRPDVAILDVNMPAGNGLSVCEMMASEPNWKYIPVIILTGQGDEATIRRCHELCAYYIPKGGDVWPRVEPVIYELVDLAPLSDAEASSRPSEN